MNTNEKRKGMRGCRIDLGAINKKKYQKHCTKHFSHVKYANIVRKITCAEHNQIGIFREDDKFEGGS